MSRSRARACSQTSCPSSSGRTSAEPASGWPGATISARSLARKAWPAIRSSSGGRPAIATSTACSSTRSNSEARFATSSERLISGWSLREAPQKRGHDELGRGRDGDEAQAAHRDVCCLAGRLPPLLDQPEDVGRVGPERRPGRCQADAPPDPLGQLGADLPGERGDGRRDRRLRDVELLRRARDGALARDGEEAGQLVEGDGHSGKTIKA